MIEGPSTTEEGQTWLWPLFVSVAGASCELVPHCAAQSPYNSLDFLALTCLLPPPSPASALVLLLVFGMISVRQLLAEVIFTTMYLAFLDAVEHHSIL